MEISEGDKRDNETGNIARICEQIVGAIFCRDYDQAAASIEAAREKLPAAEMHRLLALAGVLRKATGNLRESIDRLVQAYSRSPNWLPHLYRLADDLMDAEEWSDADVVLAELISLSEMEDEHYFLNDARMRKIICLKRLNREGEIGAQKSKIPSGSEFLFSDGIYRVDDF